MSCATCFVCGVTAVEFRRMGLAALCAECHDGVSSAVQHHSGRCPSCWGKGTYLDDGPRVRYCGACAGSGLRLGD